MRDDEYVTPEEAAAILRVTRTTIWRKLRSGEIPARRIGRLWRIKRSDLDKALSGEAPSAPPRPRES